MMTFRFAVQRYHQLLAGDITENCTANVRPLFLNGVENPDKLYVIRASNQRCSPNAAR